MREFRQDSAIIARAFYAETAPLDYRTRLRIFRMPMQFQSAARGQPQICRQVLCVFVGRAGRPDKCVRSFACAYFGHNINKYIIKCLTHFRCVRADVIDAVAYIVYVMCGMVNLVL